MPHGMFTDREKHGFGALFCQRPENGWRIAGPRTVVEGEYHFPITEEIVGLEMLKSEARSSRGVDFNDTCDAMRGIEIAIAQTVAARIRSIPSKVAASESNQVH